jgi:drug/metabolite transporter (DMT)-like permease
MDWYSIALISAIFSATAAIIEKKVLFKERALEFSLVLGIVNAILASIFFIFVDFSKLTWPALTALLIKSIFGASFFLCVMHAIKNLELSDALPLLVVTPALVALFELIFFGHSLKTIELAGMFLVLSGAYVLKERNGESILSPIKKIIKSKGHHYVLAALVLTTISAILERQIIKGYGLAPEAFIGFSHLFYAIIFIIIFIYWRETHEYNHFKIAWKRPFWWMIALGFITIIYRYAEVLAVKNSDSVALVLTIKRLSVFFAVLVGGKLFKERNLTRRIIATALLTIGAILLIP